MNVRRLTAGDEDLWRQVIEAVLGEASRDGQLISEPEIARALADSRCYLFVAMQDSNPLGLLSGYRFPDLVTGGDIVYLYDIEVLTEHRRRGFGSELIRSLIKCCEAENVKLIWLGRTPTTQRQDARSKLPELSSRADHTQNTNGTWMSESCTGPREQQPNNALQPTCEDARG